MQIAPFPPSHQHNAIKKRTRTLCNCVQLNSIISSFNVETIIILSLLSCTCTRTHSPAHRTHARRHCPYYSIRYTSSPLSSTNPTRAAPQSFTMTACAYPNDIVVERIPSRTHTHRHTHAAATRTRHPPPAIKIRFPCAPVCVCV